MLDFSFEVSTKSLSFFLFSEQMEPTKYFVLPIPDFFFIANKKLVTRWGIIDDLMNKKGHHKSS
jgi:hypothetical protein